MGNEKKVKGAEAVFLLLVCSVENMPLTICKGVQNAWQFRQWCSGSKPVSKIRKHTRDVKPQRTHRAHTGVLQQQEKSGTGETNKGGEREHQGLGWTAVSPEGSPDDTSDNVSQVGRAVGHTKSQRKEGDKFHLRPCTLRNKQTQQPWTWIPMKGGREASCCWEKLPLEPRIACLRACREAQRNNLWYLPIWKHQYPWCKRGCNQ